MILVFDLDDTLYPEINYVKGGFRSVAEYLTNFIGNEIENLYEELITILQEHGRGEVFDRLLNQYDCSSKRLIYKCISIYRNHKPDLKLYSDAVDILKLYRNEKLYIVTDGNKYVQQKKILALGLEKYFKKIFITHRYGITKSKPSLYCFEKIVKYEKCEWEDILYVGDNPNKDFVNLNKVNAKTVRLLRGPYKDEIVRENFDAKFFINNLDELRSIILA